MTDRKTNVPRKWDVVVIPGYCKNCTLCVEICPTKVLEMNEYNQIAEVVNLDVCTGCNLCEMLCPDFAIEVRETATEALEEDPAPS